ncbi:MAG: AI-2E family transporter [Lachnospiraceae bacterium]|nr:AI-2E family transporter [Lachnospiraceae bacterium]MDD3616740.1 AI-2E family transporter [Lachnospiraceae bacterium]
MKEHKKIIWVGIVAFGVYLAIYYWSYVTGALIKVLSAAQPLLIGCALAYIVNILMKFYEGKILVKISVLKKGGRMRMISVLMSLISIILILSGIFNLIIPELISCIQTLAQQVPKILKNMDIDSWIGNYLPQVIPNFDIQGKLIEMVENFAGVLSTYMGNAFSWVSSVASMVVSVFVAFVFCIYLLFGKEKVGSQLRRMGSIYLKEKWMDRINYVLDNLDNSFHKFIVGQTTEAVILGSLCIIGMLILRLPYAVMIGTFIGFTALIPIAGAYIGAAVGAVMILTVEPFKALIFLIFVVALQQIEGNLIYPKVVGSSIGLPGIWVFAAITIGGGVLGIPGMLLGVPVTAAVYQMVKEISKNKEAEIKIQE